MARKPHVKLDETFSILTLGNGPERVIVGGNITGHPRLENGKMGHSSLIQKIVRTKTGVNIHTLNTIYSTTKVVE